MNLFAVLSFLTILFVLVYGLLRVEEGFETIQPKTQAMYKNFVAFYRPFMVNWEKAITTAVGLERPAPTESSTTVPAPTLKELNQYIAILSQKLDTSLPPIRSTPLPDELTPSFLPEFSALLNKKSDYQRAIEWMNQQLEESHAQLQQTKTGEGFEVEGFSPSESMCADVVACIENNPELLDRLAKAQQANTEKRSATQQEELLQKMEQLLGNNALSSGLSKNASLVAKSDEIQNQAKSGKLLDSLSLGSKEDSPSFSLPPGANKLEELKKNNPDQYKEYEKNNKHFVEMKGLFDQINRSLR